MLIWKTIEANPEITRDGIWKLIEHAIPAGYAIRRFSKINENLAEPSARFLSAARNELLSKFLAQMLYDGRLLADGPKFEYRYSVGKKPRYHGDVAAIDLDGSKAVDHLTLAGAIRTLHAMTARANQNPRAPGPRLTMRQHEYEALQVVLAAVKNHPAN